MQARVPVLVALLLAACSEQERTPPETGSSPAPSSQVQETTPLDRPLEAPLPGDRARADRLLRQAQEEVQGSRLAQAVEIAEQAVLADPGHVDARRTLGFLLLEPTRSQNLGLALDQFRLARMLEPDQPVLLAGEGIARTELADLVRAGALLERAWQELPEDSEYRWNVAFGEARRRVLLGQAEQALPWFQKALELAPVPPRRRDRVRTLVELAQMHLDEGHADAAHPLLQEAIQRDRTDLRAHYLWSQCLLREGEEEQATRFRHIHDLLRQLMDQGSSFYQLDHDSRLRLRRELITAYPEHTRARLDLIREALDVERFDVALEELRLQAEQDGGLQAETLYLLARARAGLGDIAGARTAHDQMRQLNPSIPERVTLDILDQWRRAQDIDETLYQQTVQQWTSGR